MGVLYHILDRRPTDWNRMAKELDRFHEALKTPSPQFSASLETDAANAFANATFSKVPIDKLWYEYPKGIVSLANDEVTIPEPGLWNFKASANTTANPAVGNVWELAVWVNGAVVLEGGWCNSVQFHAANRIVLTGSVPLRVKKGDIVSARFRQNSGAAMSADGVSGAGNDPFCFFKGAWESP